MNQRTLSYVLIGSITVNAFLLGVILMHVVAKRGFMHGRGHELSNDFASEASGEQRGPRLLRGLVRAAGGPQDPRVQALWSGHRQQLKPMREEIHASRERVLTALTQDPFDRQQLTQALSDALAARQRVDQAASEGAVELADKLTPAERATLRREATPSHRPPHQKD